MDDLKPVQEWFLHRGLPLVLTRRVRSRSLIERSAPLVGGVGALVAVLLLLAAITSDTRYLTHVALLGASSVVMATAPVVLYALHRMGTPVSERTRRWTAWLVLVLFVLGLPIVDGGWSVKSLTEAPAFLVVSILAIWLTYLGIGSITLWAFRFAWTQFGALGALL
ncbi:MAG: hypothetical protein QOH57_1885, partial [Mycobacterium sp.]|nr:hypothetical protein [Mycobacterium sp.]